jgi:hypothetical protein
MYASQAELVLVPGTDMGRAVWIKVLQIELPLGQLLQSTRAAAQCIFVHCTPQDNMLLVFCRFLRSVLQEPT